MEHEEPVFQFQFFRFVLEIGQWQWKLSLGYEYTKGWPDKYLFFTLGSVYTRLWLAGEVR